MTVSEDLHMRDIAQRLAEAEATIQALLSGQIDAVVDSKNKTPVLLAKAQEALRVSEERYRRIVETTNEGVWLIDAGYKTTFMNRRMAQILGCEADMGVGRSPVEFLDQAGRAQLAAHTHRPEAHQVELRFIRADGTIVWALWGATPIFDIAGRYDGFLAMVMDITDRKRGAEELEELSQRTARRERILTTTLSCINDFAYIYDREGRFLFANQPLLNLWGITLEEAVGKNFFELGYPHDLAKHLQQQVEEVFQTKKGVTDETHYTSPAGLKSYYEYILSPVIGADETVEFVVGSTRDITRRKAVESEHLLLTERLSLATAVANLGVWEWDLANGTLIWDATMFEIYGFTPVVPMLYEKWSEAVHSEDLPAREADLQRVIAERGRGSAEFRIILQDGSVRNISAVERVVLDGCGKVIRVVGVNVDVTEQKHAEILRTAKEEAENANRAKNEFLSRMSHELRTPLNAIIGFSQVLELTDTSEKNRPRIRHILKAGRHLLRLIEEVLDFSRIEARQLTLSLEPVLIGEAVEQAIDLVNPIAENAGMRLETVVSAADALYVLGDRQRIQQVLLNMLSNAIKYNSAGGVVTISATVDSDRIRIYVTDTGMGIAVNYLPRLFQPFERLGATKTDVEGTGLGLALSKGLAEAMGGTIGVKSVVGQGTTFWLELSHTESPSQAVGLEIAHVSERLAKSGSNYTVLYIEDNLSNVRLMEDIVAIRSGVTLVPAMQGQIGLNLASQLRPDLIFLDLHLPDMPGYEVLGRLKNDPRTCTIPVIIVSADATPHQVKRLLEVGAQEYLTKPIDMKHLFRVLDEHLSKPDSGGPDSSE